MNIKSPKTIRLVTKRWELRHRLIFGMIIWNSYFKGGERLRLLHLIRVKAIPMSVLSISGVCFLKWFIQSKVLLKPSLITCSNQTNQHSGWILEQNCGNCPLIVAVHHVFFSSFPMTPPCDWRPSPWLWRTFQCLGFFPGMASQKVGSPKNSFKWWPKITPLKKGWNSSSYLFLSPFMLVTGLQLIYKAMYGGYRVTVN